MNTRQILSMPPQSEDVKTWVMQLTRLLVDNQKNIYQDLSKMNNLPSHANNAAAVANGLAPGDFYRTGNDPDLVCVVH